MQVHFI